MSIYQPGCSLSTLLVHRTSEDDRDRLDVVNGARSSHHRRYMNEITAVNMKGTKSGSWRLENVSSYARLLILVLFALGDFLNPESEKNPNRLLFALTHYLSSREFYQYLMIML